MPNSSEQEISRTITPPIRQMATSQERQLNGVVGRSATCNGRGKASGHSHPRHLYICEVSRSAAKLKAIGAEFTEQLNMQPQLFTITVLFGVAVIDANEPFRGVVKYAKGHRKALKTFGNLNSLCDLGLQRALELFEEHGDTAIQHLGVGTAWGMAVRLDALVTEVSELR